MKENNILKYLFGISAFFFVPFVVFAQGQDFSGILDVLYSILVQIVPIVITLALVFFIYNVAKFILFAGDPEKRKEGLKFMVYGIIALFVIVSIWGLVAILQNTFGIEGGASFPGLNSF